MGLALLAVLLGTPAGPCLEVVRAGQPVAVIVLGEAPAAEEQAAAGELAHYLKLATGADVPVTSEGEATPGAQIHVGHTAAAKAAGLPPEGLDRDGVVMRVAGDRLFLCGGDAFATQFAVTRFLQTQCGCRWYIPTELGEHIPQTDTLRVPDALNVVEEPGFLSRLWSAPSAMDGNWPRRNLIRSRFSFHHALVDIFKPEVFEAHPDFFPLVNGKRGKPASAEDYNWQPCFSNPGVADYAASAAAAAFDRDPALVSFSLGINDVNTYCQCETCEALTDPDRETFRDRPNRSNQVFHFMNAVAERLEKTHPDRYIGCLAYSWCEDVPTFPVHDHVIPYLTNDRAQWLDEDFRALDQELIRRWCAEQPIVGIYDYYYGSGYVIPRVFTQLSTESLKFAHRTGVRAFYAEIYSNWSLDGPKAWLASQLLWNPRQDEKALLDDFYAGMFAESAGPMRRYFELCEKQWMTQPGQARWFKGFFDIQQMELFPPDACRQARGLLGEAEARAKSDLVKRRVQLYGEGFRYTELYSHLYFGNKALAGLRVRDRASLERGLALAREISDAGAELETYDPNVIQANPLHKSPIPFLERARVDLSSGLMGFLTEAMTWADENDQWPAVGEFVAQLTGPTADTPAGRLARALMYLHDHPGAGTETAVNGGVEEAKADAPAPEGIDWTSEDMPGGWGKWLRPGTPGELVWTTEEARSGRASLKAKGATAACFLQSRPVQPGEEYLCSCYVSGSVPEGTLTQLLVQWHDAEGQWFEAPKPAATLPAGQTEGWQRLQTFFRVPEGATEAVICLVTYDQGEEGLVYFDDVSCLRLDPSATGGPNP